MSKPEEPYRAPTERAAKAEKVLTIVESWIAEFGVSGPDALLQVDSVCESLPELAEKLGEVVGWDDSGDDEEGEPEEPGSPDGRRR